MRLSFVRHEQAVHVKRRRYFLGVLFLSVRRLKCCRYLGISDKVAMLFKCCFYRGQPAIVAIKLKIVKFFHKFESFNVSSPVTINRK